MGATRIDFCESKYEYSRYIAEFHNTWSSLAYTVCGVYTYRYTAEPAALALASVGLGSIALHASMQPWGEWLDEISMLCYVALVLCAALRRAARLRPGWRAAAARGVIAANVGGCALYAQQSGFGVFWALFTLQAALLLVLLGAGPSSLTRYLCSPGARACFARHAALRCRMVAWLLAGKAAWLAEQGLRAARPGICAAAPWLHWLHVAWHLCSACSAMEAVVLIHMLSHY